MHKPVLLEEVIRSLLIKEGEIYVDATIGGGGHAKYISDLLGTSGTCIGIDMDSSSIEEAKSVLNEYKGKKYFEIGSFRNMESILKNLGITQIDKVLFDLGYSSYQIDDAKRGFSFMNDGPILMSYKKDLEENDLTGAEIVNSWSEENLATIIYGFGGERYATRIAKKIIEERNKNKITSTFQLRDIILQAVPSWYRKKKINPATKTFQAIRIAVNNEFETLKEGINSAWNLLSVGGRVAVISFHSLEDRLVKNFFREKVNEKVGILINKKVIVPMEDEVKKNRRSRSAKLRVIEKI